MHDFNSGVWLATSDKFVLPDDEVHIWRARLGSAHTALQRHEAWLSKDERCRAAHFYFARDRNNFIAGRGILRKLLGTYLGISPAALEFFYGDQGKPFLKLRDSQPPIQFNLSHARGLILFAFARDRMVGIDLEQIRPDFTCEEIAEQFFSTDEIAELHALPPERKVEGFFLCWTRKEAYMKARGSGLQIPLDSFSVSLTPGQPEALRSADASRWTLRSFEPAPGFVGALVGEGQGFQLRHLEWPPAAGSLWPIHDVV